MKLEVEVIGAPAPKGSKRVIKHKHTGRPVLIESAGRSLVAWETAIVEAVTTELAKRPQPPMVGPVAITIRFRFPPTKSDPYRFWHATKPDADKLARGVLDCLSGIAIGDDAAVCKLTVSKRYINDSELPGCSLSIEPLADEESEHRERRKENAARARRAPALQSEALPL